MLGVVTGKRLERASGAGDVLCLDLGDRYMDVLHFDNSLECSQRPCEVSICVLSCDERAYLKNRNDIFYFSKKICTILRILNISSL